MLVSALGYFVIVFCSNVFNVMKKFCEKILYKNVNFCEIIFNLCKTNENAKIFLQGVKVTQSRNEDKVFLNYDISLRFRTLQRWLQNNVTTCKLYFFLKILMYQSPECKLIILIQTTKELERLSGYSFWTRFL